MTRRFRAEQLAPQACDDADDVASVPTSGGLTMNPKLDGYRLICVVEDDHVDMMSRGLKWQDGKLPDLEAALLARFPAGTVLDGEITAIREVTVDEMAAGDGRRIANDFERVASVMQSNPDKAVAKQRFGGALTFYCFDLLMLAGEDLTDLPLAERLKALDAHLADDAGDRHFQLVPYVEATQENHDGFVRAGFEGTVVKSLAAPYAFGQRGRGWYKIKAAWTMDVVVTGFVPGKGQHTGKVGAFEFSQVGTDGQMVVRGHARGFDNATMDSMTDHPELWLGTVVEIGHNGAIGTSGKVRHPRFYRTRPDKQAADCNWRIR